MPSSQVMRSTDDKTVISVHSPTPPESETHPSMIHEDGNSLTVKSPVIRTSSNRSGVIALKVQKLGHRRVFDDGEITYKKFETTQLMGSIQLGIQQAVGSLASVPHRDLLMQDFMPIDTVTFNRDGNKTPAHNFSEFRFRTFAPVAFRTFRKMFEIDQEVFLMSLCSSPMRELANPGVSGSIFYLTRDDNFIVKTVQHKEAEFLQKLLPGFYLNLQQNKRTLLPKFFGLYCYSCNAKNVRIVIMNNLLPSGLRMHHRFDLKGSTYKRKANRHERNKSNPTYKDLDFHEFYPEGIFLKPDIYDKLMNSIFRDCRFLESFKIMDYSLLIGIHNLDQALRDEKEEISGEPSTAPSVSGESEEHDKSHLDRQGSFRERIVAHSTALESITMELETANDINVNDISGIKNSWGGIPAKNHRGDNLLLFIGIIDILQEYGMFKKVEHYWKSLIHDGDTVSVHRPGFYAIRFQAFMKDHVFKKLPSPPAKNNSSFRRSHFRRTLSKETAIPPHSPPETNKIPRGLSKQDSVTVIKIGDTSSADVHLPPVLQDRPAFKKKESLVTINKKDFNVTPPPAYEEQETGSIITMTSDEKVQIYVPSPQSTPYNTITKMSTLSTTTTSASGLWNSDANTSGDTITSPEMVKISISSSSDTSTAVVTSLTDRTIIDDNLPSLPNDGKSHDNNEPISLSDINLEDNN